MLVAWMNNRTRWLCIRSCSISLSGFANHLTTCSNYRVKRLKCWQLHLPLPLRASDMRIGELARATGTQIETIRYYERVGLLASPARTEGNFRIYADAYAERLSFIRHCRSLDMTLDEIRALLRLKDAPTENCDDVNTLLDAHIGHVAARIRELGALEKQLKSLRERCREAQDAAHCGILNELSQTSRQRATNGVGHVRGLHGGVRARKT